MNFPQGGGVTSEENVLIPANYSAKRCCTTSNRNQETTVGQTGNMIYCVRENKPQK